jgi:N-acyl-D-amino-acid deacylase
MGTADRAPTADELDRMKARVDRAMRNGAWGLSTGLIYVPGIFAETDEIIALAEVAASHDGLYVTHLRDEGARLVEAVAEALEIGRRAGLPVHVSHFKAKGVPNWGRIRDAVAEIEQARRNGLAVTADQYPYVATATSLRATLMRATDIPGGRKDLFSRMEADATLQSEVRDVIHRRLEESRRILIASSKKFAQYTGRSLREIAAEHEIAPVELVLEIVENGGASVVNFALSEEDVRYAMVLPWVATASDGEARLPQLGTCPHPRNYGTFPRKVGRYARDWRVVPMAQAIRSCSGLPADVLGLPDRGYLRPGAVADVVVFDPEIFIDRATFDDPHQYSTGVRYLFVGGRLAIEDGEPNPKLHGRAIRHRSK